MILERSNSAGMFKIATHDGYLDLTMKVPGWVYAPGRATYWHAWPIGHPEARQILASAGVDDIFA